MLLNFRCGPARRLVSIAVAVASAALTAQAQTPEPTATPLAEITNTATRTERRTDAVPATVTVTTAAEAERRAARDLKDLFRNEVDLVVRASGPRFTAAGSSTGRAGNEGINIRGLEGNQVLMLVDGIRVPQAFSFGAFSSGRVDYLQLDGASTVDVLRGPASTQFGSDGLAGAVAVRTLEPSDLLKPGPAKARAGFLRAGGTTLDNSTAGTGAVAWRDGHLQMLMLVSARRGHENDTQGANASPDTRRTAPNPLRYSQQGGLAKVRLGLSGTQRVGLTLEGVRRATSVNALSARAAPPTPPAVLASTAVLALDAQDFQTRARASLEWTLDDLNAAFIQQAEAKLYSQQGRVTQNAFENRNTATDRVRAGRYTERIAGFSGQATASMLAPLRQRLSAGIDISESQITGLRDGTVPPPGETFPAKPFPDTRYRLLGAFAQSEIEAGAFTLIPALRLDGYQLSPQSDGYVGGAVVALQDQAATPRLGVVWRASEALRPYAQWSRGFRAPTPDQVNNGFTNVASGYRSVGNANLKAERARSVELGLRGTWQGLRWQVAAYDNRYDGFISQEQVSGSLTVADPAVFQFVNLAQARIRGGEARVNWQMVPGWTLSAAAAAARGETTRNGVTTPLITVEPAKASLGLRHDRGAWQWRADVLHARGKEPSRIAAANPATFAPPAYTALDLGASLKLLPRLALHLNVDNALDETYWRWSDVRGVPGNSAVKDAFTAPGRNVSLVARLDF